jgi:membrane protein involved in colicin uptake
MRPSTEQCLIHIRAVAKPVFYRGCRTANEVEEFRKRVNDALEDDAIACLNKVFDDDGHRVRDMGPEGAAGQSSEPTAEEKKAAEKAAKKAAAEEKKAAEKAAKKAANKS